MIIRAGHPRATSERDGPTHRVDARRVSEAGGLTRFGAHVHTLQPGWRSSDLHRHEQEDESLCMLSGEATVIEDDDEHELRPGDAACRQQARRTRTAS